MGSKKNNFVRGNKRSSSLSVNNNYVKNRGAWTEEEDTRLSQFIEIHGPRRWKSLASKSGLKRCGKSCRLRWLNYLRPDIKRGNISLAEDDLILRLHRLLGNRWSLIARRLPGRTDNEIKNYWNSHLSRKAYLMEKLPAASLISSSHTTLNKSNDNYSQVHDDDSEEDDDDDEEEEDYCGIKSSKEIGKDFENEQQFRNESDEAIARGRDEDDEFSFPSADDEPIFDFSTQGTNGLEWVRDFLELEAHP